MPDTTILITMGVFVGATVLFLVGGALLYARMRVVVDQGQALLVTAQNTCRVHFVPALVLPVVQRAERMDISLKTITVERKGSSGLLCHDSIRADVAATFFVRVNNVAEDVRKVAQTIGCERAGDTATLEELFVAKFSDGLKTVASQLKFTELFRKREEFREQVLQVIGEDLSGYVLDDLAIDFLEQTPVDALDPSNIQDAEGLRVITELTAAEEVRRLELERELAQCKANLQVVLIEQARRKADALASLSSAGIKLTDEALEERIQDSLQSMVRPVVEEILRAREDAGPTSSPG